MCNPSLHACFFKNILADYTKPSRESMKFHDLSLPSFLAGHTIITMASNLQTEGSFNELVELFAILFNDTLACSKPKLHQNLTIGKRLKRKRNWICLRDGSRSSPESWGSGSVGLLHIQFRPTNFYCIHTFNFCHKSTWYMPWQKALPLRKRSGVQFSSEKIKSTSC